MVGTIANGGVIGSPGFHVETSQWYRLGKLLMLEGASAPRGRHAFSNFFGKECRSSFMACTGECGRRGWASRLPGKSPREDEQEKQKFELAHFCCHYCHRGLNEDDDSSIVMKR